MVPFDASIVEELDSVSNRHEVLDGSSQRTPGNRAKWFSCPGIGSPRIRDQEHSQEEEQ